ncbi:MAG: prepilin-type N-terminal cleavage/methylation domain-containing protein [Gemmatimonadetes bacterium]|nr:prepilin-type N-terminal cleavage/methylation domain-containing protein [Gemmatimonadota bacterium]
MTTETTSRHGFTMIELLISMTVGLLVLGGTLAFAQTTWRDIETNSIREDTYRDARFVSMALERDFAYTGVGMASNVEFGSLMVSGDTVMILSVPYTPMEAYAHDLDVAPTGANPLPTGGTCGPRCVNLKLEPDSTTDIAVGDLLRLQVNNARRLLLVEDMTAVSDTSFTLDWANHGSLMHFPAGLSGGLRLDRWSTYIQRLAPVIYYVQGTTLYRAEGLTQAGSPNGQPIADGIHQWDVKVIFADGDEADAADPNDGDLTNDYDDLLGVRITAEIGADVIDVRVDDGERFTRDFEWRFTPRNLTYERNR